MISCKDSALGVFKWNHVYSMHPSTDMLVNTLTDISVDLSSDMSVNMSADILVNILVEMCPSTYQPTYE